MSFINRTSQTRLIITTLNEQHDVKLLGPS